MIRRGISHRPQSGALYFNQRFWTQSKAEAGPYGFISINAVFRFVWRVNLYISALSYKIRPTLRAVDTHLSMSPGNTHLLFAFRAFIYAILSSLCKTEFHLSPIFRHIKPVTQKDLVLLVSFAHIFGEHTKIHQDHSPNSQQLQHKRGQPPPYKEIQNQQCQNYISHKLPHLIYTISANHKLPEFFF